MLDSLHSSNESLRQLCRNVRRAKKSDEHGGAAQELSRWPCEWRQFRLKREVSFIRPPAQPPERPVNPIFGPLLATFLVQNNQLLEFHVQRSRELRLPPKKFNSASASHLIWTSYLYLLPRSRQLVWQLIAKKKEGKTQIENGQLYYNLLLSDKPDHLSWCLQAFSTVW